MPQPQYQLYESLWVPPKGRSDVITTFLFDEDRTLIRLPTRAASSFEEVSGSKSIYTYGFAQLFGLNATTALGSAS